MTTKQEPLIFCACNPMIDLTARVDIDFLKKYGLTENHAIVGDDTNYSIYEELKSKYSDNNNLQMTTGGSGLNTMKTITWILGGSTLFMGCIGKDEFGIMIKEKMKKIGLQLALEEISKAPTASCAVLLTNNNRTMVAHIGAVSYFSLNYLEKHLANLESIKIFYVTGFFFCSCREAVLKIAKYCHIRNRVFAINLSSVFITKKFAAEFIQIMPFVDIIFGNEESNNLLEICKSIAIYKREDVNKKRIVVITRAEKPVIYSDGNYVKEIIVCKIEHDRIVDTTGAGDAFCGGFLAQFVKNQSLEKCIDCGLWASKLIIQRQGCDFTDKMDYV